MRIIIELTEAESRAAVVHRDMAGAGAAEPASAATAPADAGPPPEPLLSALGGRSEPQAAEPGAAPGADGGAAPSWLEDMIRGMGRRPA